MDNFKTFIFDLGNVIIDIDYERSFDALRALSKEPEAKATTTAFHNANLKYEQGLISTELFINTLLRYMRPKVHAKQVIDAWNAMLLDIPAHRLRLLKKIGKNHEVVILSNTNALHIQWVNQFLKKHHQILDFCAVAHHVFYSHELKDRKPNLSIFNKVISRSGIEPSQALFFDDKIENVESAQQSGIHAILSPKEQEIEEQINQYLC